MGLMSWNLYTKIIDDYEHLMGQYTFKGKLGYCQMGEPFILKDIATWVKYAIDRGIDLYFNTNASLLSPAILDSLLDIGFKGDFNISFHAITKDIYENTMRLDYSKTMDNINYLLKIYPRDKVSINAVSYNWPAGEKEKLRTFWNEKGVRVTISQALSRSGLSSTIEKTQRKKIAGCRTERVLYEMVISFDGHVLLCCHDMAREVVLGNLNDSTISEIWNGEKFLSVFNEIYSDHDLPSDFICRRCEESELYWSLRRIVKHLMPKMILKQIRKRRNSDWVVTKRNSVTRH
jgi:radical SAM protein with 4Fe4S-binding SPASM domain